jgi:shikimate kinase
MFTSTNIVLIGMPGSGKTTVGQRLAKSLDLRFHDSDHQIAKSLGLSIPDIFAQKGEAYFRHHESMACNTLLQHSEGVIALGSGAVLAPDIRPLLALHTVVYLKTSLEVLHERLPALPLAHLEALHEQYAPPYERAAQFMIHTDTQTPEAIVRSIRVLTGISETEIC